MLFSLLLTVASCLPSVFVSTRTHVEGEIFPSSPLHSSVENSANVLDGAQVTVFTHGMGGTYKDWLSEDSGEKFVTDNNYLPFSVSKENAFVLNKRTDFGEQTTVSLFPIEFDSFGRYKVYEYENEKIDTIVDASKHIVLIYNGFNDTKAPFTNEEVYAPFEVALDTVLANLSEVLGGTPQVNLVGHSRGGLVNLLYALDHPRVVRNLISIGTPYWGSTWGDALVSLLNVLPEGTVNIAPEPYGPLLDPSSSVRLFARWRDEPLCAGIRATAISCAQSFAFFSSSLLAESVIEPLYQFFRNLLPKFNVRRADVSFLLMLFCDWIAKEVSEHGWVLSLAASLVASALAEAFPGSSAEDYADVFACFANILLCDFHSLSHTVYSDVLVDLASQRGVARDGSASYPFAQRNLYFDLYDPDALEPARSEMPSVLHNLETKAPTVKEAVLSILAENPRSRHSHFFEVGTDARCHFLSCYCGAKIQNCEHSMAFDHGDAEGDHFSCPCGYSTLKRHDYLFTFTEGIHLGRCRRCERILSGEHNLSPWRNATKAYHVSSCPCGYSKTAPHEYIGTKKRCVCGRFSDSSLELYL